MLERLLRSRPYGFRVTPNRESVAVARQRVISVARGWQLGLSDDQLDDLRLLTSEVVTNAIAHTNGACAVCVRWTGMRLRVEVTDADPVVPERGDSTPHEESGRGLLLVATLSAAWGVDPDAAGKTVWFEIIPDEPVAQCTQHIGTVQSRPCRAYSGLSAPPAA